MSSKTKHASLSPPLNGTCGHYLRPHDGPDGRGNPVIVRQQSDDGTRAVSFRNVCNACRQEYLLSGMLLLSTQDQYHWLGPLSVGRPR